MPFYRFQIDTPHTMRTTRHHIRRLIRKKPSFLQSFNKYLGWRPKGCPHFIGTLNGAVFRMRRDIRGINSFLPQIRGSITAVPAGTKVIVNMYIHPVTAVLVLCWFGAIGTEVVSAPENPAGLLIVGIMIVTGCFYFEAFKARRLIEQAIAATDS